MGCVMFRIARLHVGTDRGIVRMPKHVVGSRLNSGYELSTRSARSINLRWICGVVSLSMSIMGPPQ
jgi:hypothetical protein